MGALQRMNLCDQNFWLALVLPPHDHHPVARAWWESLATERALFCRSTQQGFLRLLTTQAVLEPYGLPPRTQTQAWKIYRQLASAPTCGFLPEPEGIDAHWEQLSSRPTASPKLWMDAYLAAFAIQGDCTLVTFDHGFRQFAAAGLRLELLAKK